MSLRKRATAGFIWTFVQKFGNQLVAFVVSIILARLLIPEDYGLIGMVAVFVAIGRSLTDVGLTQSLIRNKEVDEEDYSTVFLFNLGASILIYLLIFFSAPFISEFYNEPDLTNITRILCLTFVIGAFGAIQMARLTKTMDFKTLTIISFPSMIVSATVGIYLALNGYGVWSLVWSRISSSLVGTGQLWFYSAWYPKIVFNGTKFKNHFNFGYKLTLSGLIDTVFKDIYVIIIGKYFAASQVGYFTKSQSLKDLPVKNISSALNKVTYPLLAEIQDDDIRLKRVYKQIMEMVILVVAPILIFAAVLAEPTFRFVLTEKWLPAVPFFQILCVGGIMYPLNSYNLNVLKVKGRSDLFLKLELIKKAITIMTIIIALQFGIFTILYSYALLSIFVFFVNSFYTGKFISYSIWEQIKDIVPILIIAAVSGLAIFLLDLFLEAKGTHDFLRFSIGFIGGSIIYLSLIKFLKPGNLRSITKLFRK